jgi:hypothetical protein
MIKDLYARWMYGWETRLTTQDENRVVRPLEWGFEWVWPFLEETGATARVDRLITAGDEQAAMRAANETILAHSERFFGYERPLDFRLEERHPMLFPTNVRPETLERDAQVKALAAGGKAEPAQFLRFTSPERTPYPENDLVNARWYPAPAEKQQGKPKQAIVVMPQWNADAFSHNVLCRLFNRFGISALRLSKPYHDIRRPSEIERSDYAVSANLGRTLSAARQAVVDVRCCLDWLEEQGYEQFGVLGTSLGSCYAFLASAFDARLRVNAFNHCSTSFGDVVWAGQSTRHIRQGLEDAGLSQEDLRELWAGISPVHYYERFVRLAGTKGEGPGARKQGSASREERSEIRDPVSARSGAEWPLETAKKILLVYAQYDLTFPLEYSLQVVKAFRESALDCEVRVLPCGHYTTGETPFQYMDGWYLGSFVFRAFRGLAREQAPITFASNAAEKELVSR